MQVHTRKKNLSHAFTTTGTRTFSVKHLAALVCMPGSLWFTIHFLSEFQSPSMLHFRQHQTGLSAQYFLAWCRNATVWRKTLRRKRLHFHLWETETESNSWRRGGSLCERATHHFSRLRTILSKSNKPKTHSPAAKQKNRGFSDHQNCADNNRKNQHSTLNPGE